MSQKANVIAMKEDNLFPHPCCVYMMLLLTSSRKLCKHYDHLRQKDDSLSWQNDAGLPWDSVADYKDSQFLTVKSNFLKGSLDRCYPSNGYHSLGYGALAAPPIP